MQSYAVCTSFFHRRYRRAPSNREIQYLYNARGYKKGVPYICLESAVSFKPVLDLHAKVSAFKKHWLYVRDLANTLHKFTLGCKCNFCLLFFENQSLY